MTGDKPLNENNVLKAALEYSQRGWSIIPVHADKTAACRWRKYQRKRPDEKTIKKWFLSGKYDNLAVICGAVSGGLAVLDLDSKERCQWWRSEHPEYAETLPTVKTRKGLHVYFQVESFPKRNGDKLDLLCEGAYAILPPSQDKQWLTPLNGNLSLIDPFSLGLEQFGINRPSMTSLSNQDFTEETEDTEDTDETDETEDIEDCEAICVSSVEFESLDVKVQCYVNTAITSTLPRKEGNRNRSIFRFCRWLKGHPAFEKLKAKALRPLVKMWYNQALPTIDTKIFDETWADFCYGWARVKYPKGNGMLKIAIQNALNSQQIIAAESLYEKQEIKLLVRICYELQKLQKDEPFWLAENDGAWILGVTRPTIGKWFSMLEADEVIKRVKKYTSTQATRYKFIGD